MKISISDLAYGGFRNAMLKNLPKEIGIECFQEFGTVTYWKNCLTNITNQGERSLTFHGPCVGTNLADVNDLNWEKTYHDSIDMAATYKAEFIVVHTNERFEGNREELQNLVKERLSEIINYAQTKDISVVIENVGLIPYNNVLFKEQEYIELVNSFPTAYSLIDVGHAHVNNWDTVHVIKELKDKIIGYHLHDNDGTADSHLFIGEGFISWTSLLPEIKKNTPEATLVLEYAKLMDIEVLTKHILEVKKIID